jgi:hypothetical protein
MLLLDSFDYWDIIDSVKFQNLLVILSFYCDHIEHCIFYRFDCMHVIFFVLTLYYLLLLKRNK